MIDIGDSEYKYVQNMDTHIQSEVGIFQRTLKNWEILKKWGGGLIREDELILEDLRYVFAGKNYRVKCVHNYSGICRYNISIICVAERVNMANYRRYLDTNICDKTTKVQMVLWFTFVDVK